MILILQDEMLGLNAIYDGIVKKTFCLKLPQYFMVSCTIKQKASLCRLQGIKSIYIIYLNYWHFLVFALHWQVFALWTFSVLYISIDNSLINPSE